jgi:flagellar biosynthesis chaperone FliJ
MTARPESGSFRAPRDPSRPDSGIMAARELRQRKLDETRQVLAERELVVQHEAAQLSAAESRVRMVLLQMDAAQRATPGVSLAVAVLGDLERLLQRCEAEVSVQRERLEIARTEADTARGAVAAAHQQVRALELVLEARAAERAEKERRVEIRLADETAARVHTQNLVSR